MKATKDRIIARFYTRFPALVKIWARTHPFVTNADTPWAPLQKELEDAKVALVTTAGVHLRSQPPYDMQDKQGDPTFRQIPSTTSADDLMITHNYYDHSDADQDINVVFPLDSLRELESEGMIGGVAPRHFLFMGHILGHHIDALINQIGPEVAGMLKADGVDAVFLTPREGLAISPWTNSESHRSRTYIDHFYLFQPGDHWEGEAAKGLVGGFPPGSSYGDP
jgi:D-proline reductase (dithiol) PrdB